MSVKIIKSILTSCFIGTTLVSASIYAPDVSARTFQLAHISVENKNDVYHHLALGFSERVKELSNGKLEIQILANAQLGGERDVTEGIQIGSIDMSLVGGFILGAFNNKAMVFDLPFLFPDYDTAFRMLGSEFTKPIEDDLEKVGLKVLGWGHGGFRNLYNTKRPIESPSDLSGMKIRVPENPIYLDTWRAFGANPTPMAWTELFTGLQQGAIDGAENPSTLFHASRFYEVAKYLTKTEHVYVSVPLIVSAKLWSSLSEADRAILQKAANGAIQEQRRHMVEYERTIDQELRAAGVSINEIDKSAFKKSVTPLYDKYTKDIGDDYMKRALDMLNR